MSRANADFSRQELHGTNPLTVTVATARRISGLGNTTLWALIKDRKLETVRIGRRRLITFRSLEALLTPNVDNELGP
jgi:excisionase family DNA binding protein